MNDIDVRVCYAYDMSAQVEERRQFKALLGEILEGLKAGGKQEFFAFSGKIRKSDITEADLIIGDPSHNSFKWISPAEKESMQPVPALIILSSDVWSSDINNVLMNPVFNVMGVFRLAKLLGEGRDPEDFGEFAGVFKKILRQVLRKKAGLHEEDLSKPTDWKAKLDSGCSTDFVSLFSSPSMQLMARRYKDAVLDIDTPELRKVRSQHFRSSTMSERLSELSGFGFGKNARVPSMLILGETGCGKTLLATAAASVIMHNRPLTKINIASYTKDSVDAVLFGSVKGSYTGSITDRLGIFIEHCGEVVFLDEIGDMDAEIQTRLLTYMDNGNVLPRGMDRPVCVPCILIAATNRDVRHDPSFRKDIVNRFEHVIEIPALRERKQDIRLLISMVLQDARINPASPDGKRRAERISLDAIEYIEGKDFPGNFRELRFCLSQAVNKAYSEGSRCICVRHLA
ncbi:MAG: sigma-54-dependent Fis family transcriptional regulator [Synergistaceae bacterium]|nr:sigma-54-dependent Fis family transcriptional regulator [Synergistaceae bacterium]